MVNRLLKHAVIVLVITTTQYFISICRITWKEYVFWLVNTYVDITQCI